MKKIKQAFSALVIATMIGSAAPAPQAQAGIILVPFVVGIVFLVIGIEEHDVLLIVLDADGNLSQDALETNLAKKYTFIDDRDVIHNLASAIRDKSISTPVVDGKKNVSLTKAEVLDLLAPTGLASLQPDAVDGLVRDLQ